MVLQEKNITKPFNATVRAYTKHEFDYHMRQLDKISSRITKDLVSLPLLLSIAIHTLLSYSWNFYF